MRSVLSVAALAGMASAHFVLQNPASAFFDDDKESQGPCGGATLNFPSDDKDLFQYHIGGEDISTVLTHERSAWLLRVTTDHTAQKDWEQVYPIYTQSGLGTFCQPKVKVPQKYEGKTGIFSVVSAATDGFLYQCAMVKFVSGTGDNFGKCSNGSATGYFDTNDQLSAMVSSNSNSGGSSSSQTPASKAPTSSASSPASTQSGSSDKKDAAMSLQAWGLLSSLMTVAAMAAAGGAFLL